MKSSHTQKKKSPDVKMEISPVKYITSYYKMQPTDYLQSFANQDSLKTSKNKGGPYVCGHSLDQKQH